MSSIKLNRDQMDLILECYPSAGEISEEGITFVVVEESDWIQDAESQLMQKIIRLDGKYYEVPFSRQGSPWTDWHWGHEFDNEIECKEVEKIEVVTHKWVIRNG
jgi:hypothetical protein